MKKTLSTQQVAAHFNVEPATVRVWLDKGYLKGARLVAAPRGAVWEIPKAALKGFKKPQRGRPKKGEKR